jgi:putative ABC transport system permease protein
VVKALDRKLLRDLTRMWSQALTIALVVASGVGGFLTSLSAVDSLAVARDRFYAQSAFADVFASLKRAPDALQDVLRDIPGVADVQTTVEMAVRIDLPGSRDPVVGRLIGLQARNASRMNRVVVRGGGVPPSSLSTNNAIPVLVSEAFASAHGLRPGDRIGVLMNGRQRTLVMNGAALSPEYVFAGLWGMPDPRGFGVFWIDHELLAAAYDMTGAFNRVAVKVAPGADLRTVREALSSRLRPYGGMPAIGREDQPSHAMLDNEIEEQLVLGTVLPAIFLAVSAFLLNVVVARLVAIQREQIAALKALGYFNGEIATHYLQWVVLTVLIGVGLGIGVGKQLGDFLTGLYAEMFRFPAFEHRLAPQIAVGGAALALGTALIGTVHAVAAVAGLPPATAMRPPAPAHYRPTLLERLGVHRIAPGLRMILRNIERRPWRTALSLAGVAAAVAIVILGSFLRDAIDLLVDTRFRLALRGDVTVWTVDPVSERARLELGRIPGVRAVESMRFVTAELVNGPHRQRTLVRGYAPGSQLYRIIDVKARETRLEDTGAVLTDRLAHRLGVAAGDSVRVDVLEGRMRSFSVPVVATVRETVGLNAYVARPALNRALGEDDLANAFVLALEPGAEASVLEATQALPRVSIAFSKAAMLRNMTEISARNVRIMSTILTTFAVVIAVGVVYNNARIALAERTWELASLRVLGFTRGEVSALLLGELAIVIAFALPVGMVLGQSMAQGLSEVLRTDQFFLPAAIRSRTYAWAAIAVVVAAAASGWVVRRRIDRLDRVAALKTRE